MLERFKRHQSRNPPERHDGLWFPLSERTEQLVDKLLGDLKHGFRAEFTPWEEDEWIYGAEPPVMVDFIVGLKYKPDLYYTVRFDGDSNGGKSLRTIPFNNLNNIDIYSGFDRPSLSFYPYHLGLPSRPYSPTVFLNTKNDINDTKRGADEMMTQLYLAEVDAEASYDNVRWPRYRST